MPYNLVLNSSNVIGSNNTEYKYNFINGCFNINEGSEMCISQLVIPYSWFNINKQYYNNATLSYKWFYGAGLYNTYMVTFPNGFYTTSDLNNYLALYMISQNQYFYNSTTGNNLYYIEIVINTTYYANQIIFNPIPTSVPSGYTAPSAGFNYNNGTNYGYPSSSSYSYTPQIIIANYIGSASIGSIIGFTSGTYPPTLQLVAYNVLSNITPNSTPINSIIVRCDMVNNQCAMPSDILDTFSINSTFGSNIVYVPSYEKWVTIQEGTYNNMTVILQDQNFNTIEANDSNILIALSLRQGPKQIKTNEIKTNEIINNSIIKSLNLP
jgi:hypothetical protein